MKLSLILLYTCLIISGESYAKEKEMIKVILIHGNGNSTISDNWLPYVKEQLTKLGVTVIARNFPDAYLAKMSSWMPFLRDELKADANTIIIGHSSGAVCAMRYAEEYPLLGTILVGVCYTDLGFETERLSGYYDAPWDWQTIKNNQQWIVQFASTDDPWIPIAEPRHVQEQLGTEYYEFTNKGHFGGDRVFTEFPECIEVVKQKLGL